MTVSTRRLLQLLGKTRHWFLHIDGTYKLIWKGFLVLISSIIDVQHRFHPVSLSLVSHEGTCCAPTERCGLSQDRTKWETPKVLNEKMITKLDRADISYKKMNRFNPTAFHHPRPCQTVGRSTRRDTKHNNTNAYLQVFTTQKEALWEGSYRQLAPLLVIADGFAAIIEASRMAFCKCPKAMCWAHVVRNLDNKLLGVTKMDRRNRFRRDLFVL